MKPFLFEASPTWRSPSAIAALISFGRIWSMCTRGTMCGFWWSSVLRAVKVCVCVCVCVCDCTNRQRFTGSSNSLPAAAGSKSNQHVPKVRSCCFSCLLIQCRNENGFTKSSSHQEGCCGCRRFAFHTFDPSTHISGQPCALAGEHVRTHS